MINKILDLIYKMETENQGQLNCNTEDIITRMPRLDTVIMVDNFIKEHSGEYKKTDLFNKLPKKMMWGTFNVILSYLVENNKIGVDKSDHVIYVYNPDLVKRFMNKKSY
ncbi:MAG: hypothetical protein Q8N99_07630 [Nanoarchaeota archaeon]|nr:hypothetical protein [Nanoarchaeota archaeon]